MRPPATDRSSPYAALDSRLSIKMIGHIFAAANAETIWLVKKTRGLGNAARNSCRNSFCIGRGCIRQSKWLNNRGLGLNLRAARSRADLELAGVPAITLNGFGA